MKKQSAEQLELAEKNMSLNDFLDMLGRQTGPYAHLSKLYQIGLEPRYFNYNDNVIKLVNEGKHIPIPIALFKQRQIVTNFIGMNQLRVVSPQFIEDAILQTIFHSPFEGYTAAQGRYLLNFSTLPIWFVKVLINEILDSKNPRITYDWVAPLQELILNHEPKPKKKVVKTKPTLGTWDPGTSRIRFSDAVAEAVDGIEAAHRESVKKMLKEREERAILRKAKVTPQIKREWHDIRNSVIEPDRLVTALPTAPLVGLAPDPHSSATQPDLNPQAGIQVRSEEFLWDVDDYIEDGGPENI